MTFIVSIKVLCLTALWGRPSVTETCFKGLNRLREEFDITVLAVHSGGFKDLCRGYDVIPFYYKNDPLGEKWNAGLREALKLKWDYLLTIGSDDLLSNELLRSYPWGEEAFGLTRCGLIEVSTGRKAVFENNYVIGCGRVIRRDVIEDTGKMVEMFYNHSFAGPTCHGVKNKKIIVSRRLYDRLKNATLVREINSPPMLWQDELNKCLDYSSECLVNACGVVQKTYLSDKILALDLKSDTNIWGFSNYEEKDFEIDWLSKEEEDAIRGLRQTN